MTSTIGDHVHIPQRIVVGTDLEAAAGLGVCCCGKVAELRDYRVGGWPRRQSELGFALYWELEEYWRAPENGEAAAIQSQNLLWENSRFREASLVD